MAALIRAAGPEPFLRAPILTPTEEFFPDPASSLPEVVDRITRRLLVYARLGDLEPTIQFFEHGEIETTGTGTRCEGVAGCFFGIEDAHVHFGINVDLESDTEHVAGVMVHEVAHAFRAHHGLVSSEREEEELLTDLTCVYLGFGLLSANSSYRFRKSGHVAGPMAYTKWSTSWTGYLSPQAQSFLLACQIAARQIEDDERRRVTRELETNQAAFVKAALKLFDSEEIVPEKALGLPPRERWPRPRAVDLPPLPPYVPSEQLEGNETEPHAWNEGRPVFRVRDSKVANYAMFGSTSAGTVGLILSGLLFRSWLGLLPFAVAGFAWGVRRGRAASRDVCSDAGCRVVLAPELTRCPNCAGEIMGRLEHPDDRLEAEEQYEQAAKERRGR
jgi:hypothetical protein